MEEYKFGPISLTPQYYNFTHDYYACIQQQIFLVNLSSQQVFTFPIPQNMQPIYIRISQQQEINEPHPKIYLKTIDKYYIISNDSFVESNVQEVFNFNSNYYLANDYLSVKTNGEITTNDLTLFATGVYPTSLFNKIVTYSNNTIFCEQIIYTLQGGTLLSFQDNVIYTTLEQENGEFYLAEAQLINNWLIILTSNGNVIIFNILSKELYQCSAFKCENTENINEFWSNGLVANHLYPIHFNVFENIIQLYAVEYPIKNIFSQQTRIFKTKLPILIEDKKLKDEEFLPFNPVLKIRIEDPEYVCYNCNYGMYQQDVNFWECPGCKNKLEKFV